MSQYIFWLGECSICAWEQCAFCCFRLECSMITSSWLLVLLRFFMSILIFAHLFFKLVNGVLKSLATMVDLSIFSVLTVLDLCILRVCCSLQTQDFFMSSREMTQLCNFLFLIIFLVLTSTLFGISNATSTFFWLGFFFLLYVFPSFYFYHM